MSEIKSKAAEQIAAAGEAAEQLKAATDREQEILDSLDYEDGKWEEIDITCPFCETAQYVYIAEDNHSCYCIDCGEDFTVSDIAAGEDGDTSFNTADYLTSDYAAANSAAAEMIDKQSNSSRKAENCTCGLPAHFGSCKDAFNDAINQQEQTGSYKRLPGETKKEYKKRLKAAKLEKAKQISGSSSVSSGSKTTSSVKPGGYTFDYKKDCYHSPFHVIAGDGWSVYAGKKDNVKSHVQQFDVILNLAGYGSVKQTHSIPIPELKQWENYGSNFREILLDWPDYGTVYLPRQFWEELVQYLKNTDAKMLVFCQGGHGRTGTAIACLLVVGLGWQPEAAIKWVRKNYCDRAIETIGQENYIKKMSLVPVTETKQDAAEPKQLAAAAASTAAEPGQDSGSVTSEQAEPSLLGKMIEAAKQRMESRDDKQLSLYSTSEAEDGSDILF